MDSVAFYVILQGPFYKNTISQINFGNTFLSSPYVLSVGIIFCHIHNNPEMKKKGWHLYSAPREEPTKFKARALQYNR
jgi:hypothetical protein